MKRSLLISLTATAALAASTYATTVDFSAYSNGANIFAPLDDGTGTFNVTLVDGSGDTDFTLHAGAISGSDVSAQVVNSGTSYASMVATRTTGTSSRPWNHVSTTTAFDYSVAGQNVAWSSTFSLSSYTTQGSYLTGLFAYSAMGGNGSYHIYQTQGNDPAGIVQKAATLAVRFIPNGQTFSIYRTNTSGAFEYWNTTSSSWTTSASSVGGVNWSLDTTYSVTLTADTTAGILTLEIVDEDAGSTIASVSSDIDETGSNALAGGLRFETGNLENNSTDGWSYNLDEVSMDNIPEPAEYALMLGVVIVLGAWLHRRRSVV